MLKVVGNERAQDGASLSKSLTVSIFMVVSPQGRDQLTHGGLASHFPVVLVVLVRRRLQLV